MAYDYNKVLQGIIIKFKIDVSRASSLDTLKNIPLWQISSYSSILSKNDHSTITVKNIIDLSNSERELKTYLLNWILHIETKLKAAMENVIMNLPLANKKIHHPFCTKIYSKSVSNKKHKSLSEKFTNAIDRFKKEEIENYKYYMQSFGHIPLPAFIKYMYFGDLLMVLNLIKEKHRVQILTQLKIDLSTYKLFFLLHDFRNFCAHDNTIPLFKSKSSRLPINIVTAKIENVVHVSQKGSWNQNILAVIVALRLMLSDSQFSLFTVNYEKLTNVLSRTLGPNNLTYYRLNGGSHQTIKFMSNMKIQEYMKYNYLAHKTLFDLKEHLRSTFGLTNSELSKYKNKWQIFDFIIENDIYASKHT